MWLLPLPLTLTLENLLTLTLPLTCEQRDPPDEQRSPGVEIARPDEGRARVEVRECLGG